MARVEIRGEQHPIGEVFSERYAFLVPPYQRTYAWTNEHAGELLEDLLGYLGSSDENVDDLNPYFLGNIVLIKGDRPDAQIVDGQQRLITLTILLAVLRSLVVDCSCSNGLLLKRWPTCAFKEQIFNRSVAVSTAGSEGRMATADDQKAGTLVWEVVRMHGRYAVSSGCNLLPHLLH
jgi:hypothetical protein